MPKTFLTDLDQSVVTARLARVRYVFSDLDGTMYGPGSCVLKHAAGEHSLAMVETLVALKRAGIEVVLTSGRNRSMMHEDSRLLGINSYIGELGGLIMLDREHNEWEYYTADMPFNPESGLTPHQVIEQTGVCERIIERWPGLIEYHNDMSTGYKYREVTVGMRGEVPDAEVEEILADADVPLEWGDNGFLTYVSAPTTLALPEGVRGRAFNITPAGLGKGRAMERFCAARGIDRTQVLAIGDSFSDFLMADAADTFILVENGLKDPQADAFLASHDHAWLVHGHSIDGWVAAMRQVLAAQGALEALDDAKGVRA